MATTQKISYGGNTSITITVGALANNAARQSAAVDNTSNLYLDALLTVSINAPTSGLSTPFLVNIYLAGSFDGTTWPGEGSGNPDGVTGIDSAITLDSPTDLILVGQIAMPTASKTYVTEPISVASAFAGLMPIKWSIIIQNTSGGTLQTGSVAHYNGIYTTSV
jgi:hypothetical protein